MFTSVRAKVVLPIVGVLVLFLTVLGYGLFEQSTHDLRSELDRNLRCQAEYVAFLLKTRQNAQAIADLAPLFIQHPDLPQDNKLIRILTPSGDILFQTGLPHLQRVRGLTSFAEAVRSRMSMFENQDVKGIMLRIVSTPLVQGNSTKYVVQVAVPADMMQASVLQMRNQIILSCLVILAAATFGGWMVTGLALKPVRSMAASAKNIGNGNIEERLPVPDSDDELAELAQTFNGMIERLDGSSRQIKRFTADASHELRTPLTIMKGEIEVALRKARSAEEWQTTMGSFLDEVNHMSTIVEDLLSLARIDSGELTMQKQIIELDEIVHEAVRKLRKMADAGKCNLIIQSVPGIVVAGDPKKIGLLVSNLLENAIKYSVSGGNVVVTVMEEKDEITLSVRDNGVGIAPEDLPRIFERFYRGKNSRVTRKRGTGLGLSICQFIAQAHGAQIQVESIEGRGSVFTVRFSPTLSTA